jgi:hypothetical protein
MGTRIVSTQKSYLIEGLIIGNEHLESKLSGLTYQNLHHRVFHLAKKLLTLSNHNGDDLLRPFLAWSYEKHLTMDWTLHIHLLTWLNQHEKWAREIKKNKEKEKEKEIVKELLTASVIHWSLRGLDHVSAKGILVTSPHMQGLAVGLRKSKTPEMMHKVVIVRLDDHLMKVMGQIKHHYYALTYGDDWRELEWKIVC